MTTGQRIKAARKKAGLTQAELAQKLDDIPFQSISQWERDLRNPKYETLVRIATALKVDWTELVPEELFFERFEAQCSKVGKKPQEVAKEAGVKTSTLSMWKTKGVTPKYGTIKRIADILNIDWTELVPEEKQTQVVISHIKEGGINGMTHEREISILESAISKFGEGPQIAKAIEELGELTVELARDLNGNGNTDAIRGELADAFVMLNQLELIYGDVTEIEIAKLERLEGLIVNEDV